MELGVLLSGHRRATEAVTLARHAEEAGLHEVWISEDYCERGAFAVAGAVALATRRVLIGLGVLNPWTRHPMVTAMEFAALDEVAEGRGVLGLGSSNPAWMAGMLGVPFERPLTVLSDTVGVLRRSLRGDRVRRRTVQHDIDAALAFTPLRPDPPIVLGVKQERALRAAARIGDGVLLTVLSPPAYVSWTRELVGDCPIRSYVAVACDDDAAAARERLRPFVATFLGIQGNNEVTRRGGLDPTLAHVLRAAWLEGSPATDHVSDELVDAFAVAGSPDDCAAGLARFAAAGLDVAIVRDDPAVSVDDMALLLRGLADVAGDV